ncbi:Octopamine receptor 2 [Fasciola gigantica]|uniref:Octopamine receptor 2 n=1 Tax=Fasciola gigantica TaxID=46835 RepID=A0A504Z1Y7_FASGI|nr:Octopamine receptor 2 [Fasciola gigantica]
MIPDPGILMESVQFPDSLSLTYDIWVFFIVLIILFLVIVITIVGNALVFSALIRFSRLRSMSNVLIGNLALSDFLLALTILPLSAVNDATGHWLFGGLLCDIWLAVDVFYCTASVWSLVAIAFDRFTATTFPIWYRGNQNQLRVLTYIVIVWILSGLICLPGLLGWGSKAVDNLTFARQNRTQMYETIKLSTKTHVYDPRTGRYDCVLFTEPHYVVYSAMGSFIIPLIIMIGLYLKIFVVLRERGRILRQNQRARVRSPQDGLIKSDVSLAGHGENSLVCMNEASSVDSPIDDRSSRGQTRCCALLSRTSPTPHYPALIVMPTAMSTQSARTGLTENESKLSVNDVSDHCEERSFHDPWIRGQLGKSNCRKKASPFFQDLRDAVPRLVICPPSPKVELGVKSASREDNEGKQIAVDDNNVNKDQDQYHWIMDSTRSRDDSREQISNRQAHDIQIEQIENIPEKCDPISLPSVELSKHKIPSHLDAINSSIQQKNGRSCRSSKQLNITQNPGKSVISTRSSTTDQCERTRQPENRGLAKKRWSTGTSNRERELARADYRERRATKRMGLIICIFILCWIPFTLMYLVRGLCGEAKCPDMPHLRMFVTWLGYANSALNPILYAVFNEQFRQAFFALLRCTRGQKPMQSNSH